MQVLANKLPKLFADHKRLTKLCIPVVNALVKVEPPQALGSTQETPPMRKSGRPLGSKDLSPWKHSQNRCIEQGEMTLQDLNTDEECPLDIVDVPHAMGWRLAQGRVHPLTLRQWNTQSLPCWEIMES